MSSRRGVVLAAALGLMALLGILVAGALAASLLARRDVWLSHAGAILSASADHAVGDVLEHWQELLLAELPLGAATSRESVIAQTVAVHVTVTTTRLPDDVLWLVADARTGGLDAGRRRVGLVARFSVPGRPPPAAIVARGNVITTADLRVSVDTTGEIDCAAPRDSPRVVLAPGAAWTGGDTLAAALDARAADSATYYLAARQRAWLDSAVAVRRVASDTTIAGGSYQGILLVDGAVRITRPFSIVGLLIARGPIEAADSLRVTGAIASFAPAPQTSMSLSSGAIEYAPCVVARMLRRASPPRPVRERSWSEIF